MYILGYPLGLIMRLLYNILHSYGWSLIIFTLLVKLIMVPLSIKQQKSSAKMAAIQPQMQEIQKMYAKNQQKMNEELQKLYQRENYNPAGGCLPMLITFLVLFGLIDVIYKPMTHILGMSSDLIAQAQGIMEGLGVAFSHYSPQTSIITSVQANPEAYSALGQDFINAVQSFDLNFLGINLGETPSLALNIMVLIPILSGVTAFLSSWIAMKNSPTPMEGPGAGTMKTMMLISPLMSLYIAFQVPAGVGIYWIISNLLMLLQSVVLNKFYNPKEMAAKARQEAEERREKERQERIEAKKKARDGDAEAKAKAKSQKEINRQKLAQARKQDAEKYGDVYTEVTDDDLE
ncbi:MAG: YidC/Oxa1 family membrane protein insertase [Negativibacillus massiliensis]|uniref:YidC/Oxa1 family membrane protein insertase n=1 Tax=Negativibacillus massiliensis TaxID=1871035 RepID=UPI00399B1F46